LYRPSDTSILPAWSFCDIGNDFWPNYNVTTSIDQNYVIGQLVRLDIPPGFGARQLNQQTGYVISIPAANQVVLTINSFNVDAFQTSTQITKPQIVAIGDALLEQ